jgi:putative lipoic acid-binding regulatory protein
MTDQPTSPDESLLKFPSDFTFKIFGLGSDEFEAAVLSIIHQHAPNLSDRSIQSRPSKNGKYRALTITVHIDSKEQLDRIYQDLSTSPHVLMAL